MKITITYSAYVPIDQTMDAELHVESIMSDHFEQWLGRPGNWRSQNNMPLTWKRRWKLNKKYRQLKRRNEKWYKNRMS